MFSIQSFGDIITNSSSETFTIHHPGGLKAIQDAVKEIFRIIAPDKNPDNYIEISLEFGDQDEEQAFNEHVEQTILPQYENLSNEDFLLNFPDEYMKCKLDYIQSNINSGEGAPIAEYCVKGLNPEGKIIAKAIENIINSTYSEERYC